MDRIRHGESLGNVDESAYVATPDWKVPLTPNGREQAFNAGEELKSVVGDDGQVFCYYSPYSRTKETMNELCQHLTKRQAAADLRAIRTHNMFAEG